MLNQPDRNVVVAVSGELVRLPNGDHGDGTVALLFGKYVKPGISYGVTSSAARFDPDTLGPGLCRGRGCAAPKNRASLSARIRTRSSLRDAKAA